ncbi:MAG TPA: hypothetical protein VNF04_16610 [Stellaceae bacterium]|nr:hypothetical protein [Stellaceae bacterium]
MEKYPALRTVAGFLKVVGWLSFGLGVVCVFIGILIILGNSTDSFPTVRGFGLMMSGAILGLFGLMVAANGELIGVFIDIEANTRKSPIVGIADTVREYPPPVSAPAAARPVPSGYQEHQRRLRVGDRVFHPLGGEGVVVAPGRDRYFVRVRFEGDAEDREMESFGLYLKT